MTPSHESTPLEDLATWIRADRGRGAPMTEMRMNELTEQAIAEGRRRQATHVRDRRRRRMAVGIGAAVALSATAAAAAVLWRNNPTAPQAGTVCRAAAKIDADAIVIEPGGDPIALCRTRWDDGAFEEFGIGTHPDTLAACVSNNGTIDVFPGTEAICADLGLSAANTDPTSDAQLLIELQDRLIAQINSIDCLSADQAAATARQILDDLDLGGWPVETNPDAAGAACAKAGIGTDHHHVYIQKI